MKTDKELYKIWKKYIDVPIYRIVSGAHYNEILRNGIDPKNNPHEEIRSKSKKLIKLLLRLERNGKKIYLLWGSHEVLASYSMKVTLHDISILVVDFTPDKKHIKYYLGLKGGAAIWNIKEVTQKILEEKVRLKKDEKRLVEGLYEWTKKKNCQNKTIYVLGSSKSFETAHFQIFRRKAKRKRKYNLPRYYPSPFGGFEHFKRVIAKQGLNKYINRLRNKEFYLRVMDKIPTKEIKR